MQFRHTGGQAQDSLLSPHLAVLLNVDMLIGLKGMNGVIGELDAVRMSARRHR